MSKTISPPQDSGPVSNQKDAQIAWQCLLQHLFTHRDLNPLNRASIFRLCIDKLRTEARVKKALSQLIQKEQLFPAAYKNDVVYLMHPKVIADILATSLPGIQSFPG